MAQEEIKYTLPSEGGGANDGRQVDLIVTYDPTKTNSDGSFTATSATGTYAVTNDSGQVTRTDTITALAPIGDLGGNDNRFFITPGPNLVPIVTFNGISFHIDNVADANGTSGEVSFYDFNGPFDGSTPSDIPQYREDGPNNSQATVTSEAPCFARGTTIHTARGDVPVESLAVGDVAITASGRRADIRWLGHRTIDGRRHPRPQEVLPIRIAAHAFGDNRPARALFVSPGHAICVDILGDVLIPAGVLVNGSTIRQVAVDTVEYWHVELDRHDVVLAENLPAESYLDMGNRSFFADGAVVALDATPDVDSVLRTHADFCRPFHAAGPLVDMARSRLRVRAESLGWRLDASDPFAGLHLVADGARIAPVTRGLAAHFAIPAGVRDLWLVSATARPCDVMDSVDGRDLGLAVRGLSIDDGVVPSRDIAMDDPSLCRGFHELEDNNRRWTTGRAHLPAELWRHCSAGFDLHVELAAPALPHWVAGTQPTPASLTLKRVG